MKHYRVWAEFDISSLAGKKIADVGFRVYNDWDGSDIDGMRYSQKQPSTCSVAELQDQHDNDTFEYAGFEWIVNNKDQWTPIDNDVIWPGAENWNNWRRPNGKSIIEDLQEHINDNDNKTWFGVEFDAEVDASCLGTGCLRVNLRFPSNLTDPSSIVMQVMEYEPPVKEKNMGNCSGSPGTCPAGGDPINIATGNEYRQDSDLLLPGSGLPMQFQRHYNSQRDISSTLGYGWTATFSEKITVDTDVIKLQQADGNEVHFIDNDQGGFISEADHKRVIRVDTSGHQLFEPDGRILSFDTAGLLSQIEDRNGNTQTLTYDTGKLSAVLDNFGRQFTFNYDANDKLETLDTPAGQFSYEINDNDNLSQVTNPDTTFKEYQFSDNDIHNLTGIVNENSALFATFAYDDQDRAIVSEYADSMFGIQVAYSDDGVNIATDSLGQNTTFTTQVTNGIARVTNTSGTGCGTCATSLKSSYQMDSRLLVEKETDPKGNSATYTYDDRGNILTQIEAVDTDDERTTTYTWHPDYNLITSITRGSRVTTLTYDANGNLTHQKEQGTGLSRTTIYGYNTLGQLTSIDGPRTDVTDVTTFTYYPNETVNGQNRGMLHEVINALGHKISFSNYNGYGKPQTSEDANSVNTTFIYDLAGRMTSRTTGVYTTSFDYDDVGNMTELHMPGNVDIFYKYTDANLLEQITDNQGNYIQYSYDTEGNKNREEIRDVGGNLKNYIDFEFDDYNRLSDIINLSTHYTTLTYDDNGNLTQTLEPDTQTSDYEYDALNRLITTTRATAVTGYEYNQFDDLVRVVDPGINPTSYSVDDFGRTFATNSPDTGNTTYIYDNDDNIISIIDPRPNTTDYQYDVLGRLTDVLFSDPLEDITYGYDAGTYGTGRLASIIDPAGTTTYTYNNLGQVTQESRLMNGVTYITGYSYDADFKLQTITYPSGMVVTYTRDNTGRITGTAADTQPITSQVGDLPFGPVKDMTFGSSVLDISRTYDQRYLLSQNNAGTVLNHGYTRDSEGKVLSISGVEDALPQGGITSYTHQANRLTGSTGQEPAQYSYDNNGNIISDGTRTFDYNLNNRLSKVSVGEDTIAEYGYDSQNRRVFKIVSGVTTYFHYDLTGNLIAETSATGTPLRDIIYQDGERVAMELYGTGAGTYWFINDHLGAPQAVINESGQTVWKAAYLPFGKVEVLINIIENNFRLPGQYFDSETGFHYNMNRYYDPDTGRYITADPIGLSGGINLFLYAGGDPIGLVDPWGLMFIKRSKKWGNRNGDHRSDGAKKADNGIIGAVTTGVGMIAGVPAMLVKLAVPNLGVVAGATVIAIVIIPLHPTELGDGTLPPWDRNFDGIPDLLEPPIYGPELPPEKSHPCN